MSALHASPLALARQPTVRRFEDRGRAAELRGARLALLGVRDALLALTEGTAAEGRALLDLLIHEVRGAHLALDGTLSLAIVDVAPREERARLRACADALHDDLSRLLERELSAPRPSAIILFDAAERVHGLVERVREFEGVSEAALALEACLLEIERFRPEDGIEERIDELAELLLSIQFLPATIARARSPIAVAFATQAEFRHYVDAKDRLAIELLALADVLRGHAQRTATGWRWIGPLGDRLSSSRTQLSELVERFFAVNSGVAW